MVITGIAVHLEELAGRKEERAFRHLPYRDPVVLQVPDLSVHGVILWYPRALFKIKKLVEC